MTEPMNGYEYLEKLREENRKETQDFGDFSVYLERKARDRGIPIRGQFELTPLCNLSCKMCYVHLSEKQLEGKELLTAGQWKHVMQEAYDAGMFQAALTGGECLTYPGFDELYLFLQSLGCQVDVLTNGLLLGEDRIRFFKDHPPALIQITLYGGSEEAYERVTGRRVFHRVVENIQRVKDAGFPLSITVTPNRFLGDDVFDTIRLAKKLSDNYFVNTSLFVPRDEPWRMERTADLQAEEYLRIFRFQRELEGVQLQAYAGKDLPAPGGPWQECEECGLECGGGRSGFVMTWKGELRICNRMEARSYPLRDGFHEAWRVINQTANSWPRVAQCRDCAYEQVCDKCAARFMEYAPPGEQPTALCERTRYMVSHGVLPLSDCKS